VRSCWNGYREAISHLPKPRPNTIVLVFVRTTMRLVTRCLVVSLVAGSFVLHPADMPAQSTPEAGSLPPPIARRDGRHDFDFSIGRWRTHITRRVHPLSGSNEWADYDGTSIVRTIWDRRASLGETEAEGPAGHLEALSLRLYNPESHQWSLRYASTGGTTSTPTSLTVPAIGEFKDGRGEFYDTEPYNGRDILLRNTWSDITPMSIRFEQAFSEDGGRTWETNWIAVDTRIEGPESPVAQSAAASRPALLPSGGQHDFDFNLGTWKIHVERLLHPLARSKTWVTLEGTKVVRKIWDGRAQIEEVEADGPNAHLENMGLMLYNPKSHQWSVSFANSSDGILEPPLFGKFISGRGEFFDTETYDGRAIMVRITWSEFTPTTHHLEQSFSEDGGRTWESNLKVTLTRAPDGTR
jgi:hypothetical protein